MKGYVQVNRLIIWYFVCP